MLSQQCSNVGTKLRVLQSHKYFIKNFENSVRQLFIGYVSSRLSKLAKNSRLLKVNSLLPVTLLKIFSITVATLRHSKKRCTGDSGFCSGDCVRSQKVQLGECPATKCATALLNLKVLLCNLKKNVFSWLVKSIFVHKLFKNFDCSSFIIMSMLRANLLILCGIPCSPTFNKSFLKWLLPFFRWYKKVSI